MVQRTHESLNSTRQLNYLIFYFFPPLTEIMFKNRRFRSPLQEVLFREKFQSKSDSLFIKHTQKKCLQLKCWAKRTGQNIQCKKFTFKPAAILISLICCGHRFCLSTQRYPTSISSMLHSVVTKDKSSKQITFSIQITNSSS